MRFGMLESPSGHVSLGSFGTSDDLAFADKLQTFSRFKLGLITLSGKNVLVSEVGTSLAFSRMLGVKVKRSEKCALYCGVCVAAPLTGGQCAPFGICWAHEPESTQDFLVVYEQSSRGSCWVV